MLELTTDEAKRTIEIARAVLDDIGEVRHCTTYRVAYANKTLIGARIPCLYLEFDYPEIADTGMNPAFMVSLTNLATGSLHDTDKLRRMIRNSVERFLYKIGRPQNAVQVEVAPMFDPENLDPELMRGRKK